MFKCEGLFVNVIIGLVSLLVLTQVWAFFSGFGIAFHIVLLTGNTILTVYFFNPHKRVLFRIYRQLIALTYLQKVFLAMVLFLVTLKSSLLNTLFDNESYYIQTINWLNEYGFVQGLANFNMFLGQTSGWHVMQSAFSFHFLGIELNDFGGFFLLLLNGLALKYYSRKAIIYRWIWILPIFNWVLIEFCKVPSPDFGIFFFSIVSVFIFLKNYDRPQKSNFFLLLVIFLSTFLVKITAVGLFVFPLVAFIQLREKTTALFTNSILIIIIFFGIWFSKNLLISGYPFFPSHLAADFFKDLNHQIPQDLHSLFFAGERLWFFFVNTNEIKQYTALELFWRWFTSSKIDLIVNSMSVVFFLISPYIIYRKNLSKAFWWLYLSFVVQIVFLGLTSPNPRFILHYVVIFTSVGFAFLKWSNQFKYLSLLAAQALVGYFIVFPRSHPHIETDKIKKYRLTYEVKNLLLPMPNSSLNWNYETHNIGNLTYNSPEQGLYLWLSGDCEIPCINQQQQEIIAKITKHIPQLKDESNLSKGFYSKRVEVKTSDSVGSIE